MSTNRFKRIEALFGTAQELEPAERCAFFDQACASDKSLRAEVESLLAYDVKPHVLMKDAGMGSILKRAAKEAFQAAGETQRDPLDSCAQLDRAESAVVLSGSNL